MRKDILLDIATESARRYGSLPPDFAEKMAKRIRRKFAVKIEPAKLNELALHYKEVYAFGKSILKDHLTPPKGIYADVGDVDLEKFLDNLLKNFPEDDSDILREIRNWIIYFEYLR
jgi:hypothetical protein